jgi:hypothetical protein
MDFQAFIKKNAHHIIAVLIFLVLASIYLFPSFEGKVLEQYDIIQHEMMAHELKQYRETTGEEALWTNSMFGGMPGYLISVKPEGNFIAPADNVFSLFLPKPVRYLFLYMLGFYFLAVVLGARPPLAIAAAVAYGFGSYFFLNLEAGHNTKVHSLAYMAPTLAAFLLILQRKYIRGLILLIVLLSVQIYQNHLQITYYTFLALGLLFLIDLIYRLKDKDFKAAGITLVCLIAAGLLSFATNSSRVLLVREYAKETTRGGQSQLSSDQKEEEKGVGRDYAYGWSYGVAESFTLIYPNAAGGGGRTDYSSTQLFKNISAGNATYEDRDINAFLGQFLYWGDISSSDESPRSTAGTIYLGAILWFFFFIALFLSPWDKVKFWLLAVTFFSLTMSWGRYFPYVIDLFFMYFPFFDKFRVPMMFLTITQLGVAGMAVIGMRDMFSDKIDPAAKMKALKFGGGIMLGLGVILLVMPGIFLDFQSFNDSLQDMVKRMEQSGLSLSQIVEDRKAIFRASVKRTTIFAAIAAVLCWLYITEKFKKGMYIAGILTVLILVDEWNVARPYLNESNFIPESQVQQMLAPTPADVAILKDGDYYRVFNITQNPLAYSGASYHHKSVSGYHAAKLQRWQDFAVNMLIRDWQLLRANQNNFQGALMQTPALNMFNVRYLILDPKAQPVQNPNALGNAWFVSEVKEVVNADSTIATMQNRGWNPRQTAVVDASDQMSPQGELNFEAPGANDQITFDVTEYQPNYLKYYSSTSGPRLAVFSEVFYRGNTDWVAYIDGKEAEHFRVNFLQRAMIIPEGEHEIEFKFNPPTYRKGVTISSIGSIISLLVIIGGIFWLYRQGRGKKEKA